MINRAAISTLLVLSALSSALRAEEIEIKIDSLVDGGTAAVQAGFVIGEIGAVVLDSGGPVTLTVLQVQIERFNIGVPIGPPTMTGRMHVWDNGNIAGGLLFPGTAVYTSPDLILTAGALNLIPILTVFIPTGAAGNIVINDTMPGGIPGGLSILVHMWAADPGGPFGACATNALELLTP